MIRAKFRLMEMKHSASASPDYVACTISMVPVWDDGKGNAQWSKATPSGKLEMVVTNPGAIAAFELGKDYLLTFEKVE